MPLFGQPGLTLDRLMMDAGLMPEPEPEGSGNIRSYAAMRYDREQAYREQVAREETPIFAYFYDGEEADGWLDFFSSTTTRELRGVARSLGLNPADLVSLEDGRTPRQMTPGQVDMLLRVLWERTGEDPAAMDWISMVVIELEDGDNPQLFRRFDGQWEHETSEFSAEELEELLGDARDNPIKMYGGEEDEDEDEGFVVGRNPTAPAA